MQKYCKYQSIGRCQDIERNQSITRYQRIVICIAKYWSRSIITTKFQRIAILLQNIKILTQPKNPENLMYPILPNNFKSTKKAQTSRN